MFGKPVEQRLSIHIKILNGAGAGVACAGQDEQPRAGGIGARQKRLQRVHSQKGVHRQRV